VSCELCATPRGDVVFEDARTRVILHEDGSPRGHAMIVAKRHVENASDLDEADWLHLTRIWHRAERVLLDATGAERAIVMKLGIMTPHLHVHIYPLPADATRAEVFDAIEGNARTERDAVFVDDVRRMLRESPLTLTLSPRR
jgi:diadenosine tetraphosphate (Ap4A) HIT family hydrolase